MLNKILTDETEYEQYPVSLKYKDENLEKEYSRLHQEKTAMFGKIIWFTVLLINTIDVCFDIYDHFKGNAKHNYHFVKTLAFTVAIQIQMTIHYYLARRYLLFN